MKLKKTVEEYLCKIGEIVIDDEERKKVMFRYLNVILAFISLVMTVVNIFTSEYVLLCTTLAFTILSVSNIVISRAGKLGETISFILFLIEIFAFLSFFTISGIPNGFSVLWTCLVPAFGIAVFGAKRGTLLSFLLFLMIILLFWTPLGDAVNMFEGYTDEFKLRMPFLYLCIYAMSMIVEGVRLLTHRSVRLYENKYKYLYCHDALTGLHNRYGMNERMLAINSESTEDRGAFLIVDLDDFKSINDTYGHIVGDDMLCKVADIIRECLCEHCAFCRWGGEEFLIYMRCDHDPLETAEKLCKAVDDIRLNVNGGVARITVSVGVAVLNGVTEKSLEKAILSADKCLYESKARGKNRITHTTIGSDDETVEQSESI